MELRLTNPVIVARSGDAVLLVSEGEDPRAMSTLGQMWDPRDGYGEPNPVQVHLKFLYYIEEVDPPEPWQEPPPLDTNSTPVLKSP